jgi:hypothetical protein
MGRCREAFARVSFCDAAETYSPSGATLGDAGSRNLEQNVFSQERLAPARNVSDPTVSLQGSRNGIEARA